jgi:hypothetical protein
MVEVTYGTGRTEQYTYLGKSTTGKSLKVADKEGNVSYISLSGLSMYELI